MGVRTVTMRTRLAWRTWLERNHATAPEIWLAYFKKHTGKASVTYAESVEEALCFGWIDGIRKRLDEERYAHRFSPRRAGSQWSRVNIERARRLIAEGKMTAAGLAKFEQRPRGARAAKPPRRDQFVLTEAFRKRLEGNKRAWKSFNTLPAGERRNYVAWIMSAKRLETRDRRFTEALSLLEANRKLGMK